MAGIGDLFAPFMSPNTPQAPTIDLSQVRQWAGGTSGALQGQTDAQRMAMGIAQGTGPSAADVAAKNQSDRAASAIGALASSGYGSRGQGAARLAGIQSLGGAEGAIGAGAAEAKAREQMAGIGEVGQLATARRAQDTQTAGLYGNLATAQAGLDWQGQQAEYEKEKHDQETNSQAISTLGNTVGSIAMLSDPAAKADVQPASGFDARSTHAGLYKPGALEAIGTALRGGQGQTQGQGQGQPKAATQPQESDSELFRRRYEEGQPTDTAVGSASMPEEYREAFGDGKSHYSGREAQPQVESRAQPQPQPASAPHEDPYLGEVYKAIGYRPPVDIDKYQPQPNEGGLDMGDVARAGQGGGSRPREAAYEEDPRDALHSNRWKRGYSSEGRLMRQEPRSYNPYPALRSVRDMNLTSDPAEKDAISQLDPYTVSSPPEAKTGMKEAGAASDAAAPAAPSHGHVMVPEPVWEQAKDMLWKLHEEKMGILRGLEGGPEGPQHNLLGPPRGKEETVVGFQEPSGGRVLDILSRTGHPSPRPPTGSGYAIMSSGRAQYSPEPFDASAPEEVPPGPNETHRRLSYPTQEEAEQRMEQHEKETELPPLSSPPSAKTEKSPDGVDSALRSLHPYSYRYKDATNEPIPNPTGKERFFGVMTTDMKKHPVTKGLVSGSGRGEQISVPGATSFNLAATSHLQHGLDQHEHRLQALESMLRRARA